MYTHAIVTFHPVCPSSHTLPVEYILPYSSYYTPFFHGPFIVPSNITPSNTSHLHEHDTPSLPTASDMYHHYTNIHYHNLHSSGIRRSPTTTAPPPPLHYIASNIHHHQQFPPTTAVTQHTAISMSTTTNIDYRHHRLVVAFNIHHNHRHCRPHNQHILSPLSLTLNIRTGVGGGGNDTRASHS